MDAPPEQNFQKPPPGASPGEHRRWAAGVIERHQSSLLAYATRLGGDAAAAQDAVQDTFVRLIRTPPQIRDEDHLAAWLFTVCRHRLIDAHRNRGPACPDAACNLAVDPSPGPAAEIVEAERRQTLDATIEQLSARQREVIGLRLHAGLSYRQIADVTGLSVSAVGFHLHAAVRSLRARLASA